MIIFILYDLFFALALVIFFLSLPVWSLIFGRRLGWRQRLGLPGSWRRPAGDVVLFHAASLGEVGAMTPLMRKLARERKPCRTIMLTTLTTNARDLAPERTPVRAARLLPFDFYPLMVIFLRRLRPKLIIVAETELWPGLFRAARRLGIPLFIVNGRISDNSYPWYRYCRLVFKGVLVKVTGILTRDAVDAERYRRIGTPAGKVKVCGDLKAELSSGADYVAGRRLMKQIGLRGKVLIGGSLHGREAADLLRVYLRLKAKIRDLRLLLAPRHLKHLASIEKKAASLGVTTRRRSDQRARGEVVLLDTHGELASLYGGAWVAFVGGSLVRRGGQNLLEAAAAGIPVFFGPHVENFRAIAHLLQEGGGGHCVRGVDDIVAFISTLAGEKRAYRKMAAGALDAVKESRGAVALIMKELKPYLH